LLSALINEIIFTNKLSEVYKLNCSFDAQIIFKKMSDWTR